MFPASAPFPRVVLQVLPALKEGGVEKSAIEMSAFLAQHGITSLVASSGGVHAPQIGLGGGKHILLPLASKNPLTMLGNVFRLRAIIRQYDVSLVHARSRAPAWSAWAACRLTGVPFICTFHGTYGLRGGKLKQFYNSVMLRSPYVIANSLFIQHHIKTHYSYPAERIFVAPRGIDPAIWNPDLFKATDRARTRDLMGVDADTPLILMVGRITPWKGHELLLRALALLPKGLFYKVAFVGNTNNNLHADRMLVLARELGLLGHVTFLGTRDDVPALMAAADMALSCSTRPEAFGRVAIEAMAMGVPVIATALGGSLETVKDGETGWLVQPASNTSSALTFEGFEPQALMEKIAEALRSPSRLVTMGQEARKHVLAHFTVEKCCQAEFEAYEKLGPTPKGKKQGNKK